MEKLNSTTSNSRLIGGDDDAVDSHDSHEANSIEVMMMSSFHS